MYAAVNPLNVNLAKSGPADDTRFLNMGFAIAENLNASIDHSVSGSHQWTSDPSTLVIRHTANNSSITHEGSWQPDQEKLLGIQFFKNGENHFGWMRMVFNAHDESVTVKDFAYNNKAGESISAGEQD